MRSINYSGVIFQGKISLPPVPRRISWGRGERRGSCQGLNIQGGIILGKMFGVKSPGGNCPGGSFMGVSCPGGKLFRGNPESNPEGKSPEGNFLGENFIGGSCPRGSCPGGNIQG